MLTRECASRLELSVQLASYGDSIFRRYPVTDFNDALLVILAMVAGTSRHCGYAQTSSTPGPILAVEVAK